MTAFCRLTGLMLIFFCLTASLYAAEISADTTAKIMQLEQKNEQLHRQLRAARRDLALERNDEQEPGWPQFFGGIGVIFGLCGLGMMLSARRKPGRNP